MADGTVTIEPATEADLPDLAAVLVDCVDGGASVGFLAGVTLDDAERFWRTARGRGVASALMEHLEREALGGGRWLLLLDTETGSAAQALYERSGWQVTGVVEDHAVQPGGRLAPTTFLVKRLRPPRARR